MPLPSRSSRPILTSKCSLEIRSASRLVKGHLVNPSRAGRKIAGGHLERVNFHAVALDMDPHYREPPDLVKHKSIDLESFPIDDNREANRDRRPKGWSRIPPSRPFEQRPVSSRRSFTQGPAERRQATPGGTAPRHAGGCNLFRDLGILVSGRKRGTPWLPVPGHDHVFLSYRREDSRHHAGRLADHLVAHFGKWHVFKDVDSIPLGWIFARS